MTLSNRKAAAPDPKLSYDESKRLARDGDAAVRVHLAAREDVRPEVLYFLAEDDSAEVRGCIAANLSTPRQADLVLALGAMTWPHMLVRGMIAEQLYRAETILSGHPYHRA